MVYAADKFLRTFLGLTGIRNPPLFADTEYEDPTYPLFHIQFIFGPSLPDATHPDFVTNRLLDSEDNPESAISYLKSISEPDRAQSLSKFISALKTISETTPYYFQGISGVDNLMKMHYPADSKTPFSEQQDVLLSVKTLDSMDFRILALKDLYSKSVFDRKYRRWMLPINLRRFRMRIMIGEYRQMAITEENYSVNPRQLMDTLKDIDVLNASNVGGKLLGRVSEGSLSFIKRLQWWDNHFSCVVFDCQDCEFEMMSAPPEFANLSQDSVRVPLSNSFGIRVGRVLNTNVFSLLKYVLSDNMQFQSFLRAKGKSLGEDDQNTYGKIFQRLIKENPEEKTAILSKQYQSIFKPVYGSWGSYQNLLRERGDNKRVILENRDFESAVSAGLNEGLNQLGIGNALGNGTNFGPGLGSVGNFVGDTLSGLAQEALGMATEQVAQNVFDNALYNSIAGTALGILNGDLNAAARSFTNPALAGALGINLETSGRAVPPNLRDGIPKNVDLTAPTVQRSLSDFRANLIGEGADPRFQSISRPGQSLFSNPGAIDKVMQPENIDFDEIRKETKFSKSNVEFNEVKKETKINPQKETLIGANPKRTLDETSANLTGSQPVRTLSPSNADLTGAQALKDLTPSNADLTGAEALKDLTPSNANLTGAQALRDLTPSNANLTGAQALKDLTPSNADLTGAQALKDLTPSNADLTGIQPERDFNTSNANLEGGTPLRDLTTSNANLEGVQPIKDFNTTNANLEGANPTRSLENSNAELTGINPIKDLNTSNVGLSGAKATGNLVSSNAELKGSTPLEDINNSNVDLTGSKSLENLTITDAELKGAGALRNLTETNADLKGASALRNLTQSNADLNGSQPLKTINPSNEQLKGYKPLRDMNLKNVELKEKNDKSGDLVGIQLNKSISLDEPYTTRDFNESTIGLKDTPKENKTLGSEQLLGSTPKTNLDEVNIRIEGVTSNAQMMENIEFENNSNNNSQSYNDYNLGNALPNQSVDTVDGLNQKNVNLEGKTPIKNTLTNVGLTDSKSLGVLQSIIVKLDKRIDDDEGN